MGSRKRTYVPKAIDGDKDGFVQDGTEFERPVDTELTAEKVIELMQEMAKVEVQTSTDTYVIQEGENIQTIAHRFKPEGMTRQEYAEVLYSLNSHWTPGKVIRLG